MEAPWDVMLDGLVLTEEEQANIEVSPAIQQGETKRSKFCLIGKVITERPVNVEAMKSTLKLIWRPARGMVVTEISLNLFIFQFHHTLDRRRVIENGLWNFDKALMLFKRI